MTDPSTAAPRPQVSGDPRRAVPVLLFLFIFCLVIDQGFKFTSQPMAADLGLDAGTVSLQATLTGVLIGIGAVVYSAMADFVAIRKIIYVSIMMIVVGSLIGFFGAASFPVVLVGRVIQTAGLAAAETLYVVYVTKHFTGDEQKKYLGFSNMSFQLASLIGTLISGFLATYVSWTFMFLVPLFIILTLPFVKTRIPDEEKRQTGSIDVYGLFLIAVMATGLIMFMQAFNWLWWIPVVVGVALFARHVTTNPNAVVDPSFFRNRPYINTLIVVFVVYSVNLAFVFSFPFAIHDVHAWAMDRVSLLTIPGYLFGAATAAMSGQVARRLSTKQTVTLAFLVLTVALAIAAAFLNTAPAAVSAAMVLFSIGFGLLYAPLLSGAISQIPASRSGVAIGFYNLVINVAAPIGIAYTATLMDLKPMWLSGLSVSGMSASGAHYTTLLWLLVGITLLGLLAYRVLVAPHLTQNQERVAA